MKKLNLFCIKKEEKHIKKNDIISIFLPNNIVFYVIKHVFF